MKLKKLLSVVALSASLFIVGGSSSFAETNQEDLKVHFERSKTSSIQSNALKEKLQFFNSPFSGKVTQYQNSADSDEPIFEIEPNDEIPDANPLKLGEAVLGTFHEWDIDTYKINVADEGQLAVAGVMDENSLADIGFVLYDSNGNEAEWVDYYSEDHLLAVSFNVVPGTYYIRAFNITENVTEDLYGVAADMIYVGDVTPPEAPLVHRFDDNDEVLTGMSEPGATIEVYSNEGLVASTVADATGRFAALINTHPEGTELYVLAIDASGNISDYTTLIVSSATFTGWAFEEGKWFYYIKGAKNHGWHYDNGKYYYLDLVTGEMKTGWVNDNNRWFFMDNETGAKQSGWVNDHGIWYYLDAYGVMKTGWIKLGTTWYYLSKSGAMQTGWVKDGASWYFLSGNGAMKTGWVKDGAHWYYLANNGVMKTGWVKSGTKWYYLYNDGKMAFSTKIGTYKLGSDGAWIQ